MWQGRVVVVVVMVMLVTGNYVSAENFVPDIPEYAKCANILFDRVQTRLVSDMDTVNTSINQINTKMDVKVSEILTQMNAMNTTLQEKTEHIALKQDHFNGSLASMLDDTIRYIEARVGAMATKTEFEDLLQGNSGSVMTALREVKEECGSDGRVSEVLEGLREMKNGLAELKVQGLAGKNEAKKCSQQTAGNMAGLNTKIDALEVRMGQLESYMEGNFDSLKDMVLKVFNKMMEPPPPPPTTTPTTITTTTSTPRPPDVLYPCEDSTFSGTSSFSVCGAAVRFNKCRLPTVAFHCCHSCTAKGLLPPLGPWRYRNQSRHVSTLNVMRFFSL